MLPLHSQFGRRGGASHLRAGPYDFQYIIEQRPLQRGRRALCAQKSPRSACAAVGGQPGLLRMPNPSPCDCVSGAVVRHLPPCSLEECVPKLTSGERFALDSKKAIPRRWAKRALLGYGPLWSRNALCATERAYHEPQRAGAAPASLAENSAIVDDLSAITAAVLINGS